MKKEKEGMTGGREGRKKGDEEELGNKGRNRRWDK